MIEGCDGSGKTHLVNELQNQFRLPIHSRASDSLNGPRPDLFEWAAHDVYSMPTQPLSIYDRHPLVSEYIYGPVIRATIDPRFLGYKGIQMSKLFAHHALVIHCDPGMDEVSKNLRHSAEGQMDGVNKNADTIYHTYNSLMHYWPGHRVVWDYTLPRSILAVLDQCKNHIRTWKATHNV